MNKGIIKNVVLFIVGMVSGVVLAHIVVGEKIGNKIASLKRDISKFNDFYWLLLWWVKNYQENIDTLQVIKDQGYHRVAIYGAKELGERTYYELKKAGIDVPYFIDRNGTSEILMDQPVKVIEPGQPIEGVDVVIVTAISYFDEIARSLSSTCVVPILSLEDVVFKA